MITIRMINLKAHSTEIHTFPEGTTVDELLAQLKKQKGWSEVDFRVNYARPEDVRGQALQNDTIVIVLDYVCAAAEEAPVASDYATTSTATTVEEDGDSVEDIGEEDEEGIDEEGIDEEDIDEDGDVTEDTCEDAPAEQNTVVSSHSEFMRLDERPFEIMVNFNGGMASTKVTLKPGQTLQDIMRDPKVAQDLGLARAAMGSCDLTLKSGVQGDCQKIRPGEYMEVTVSQGDVIFLQQRVSGSNGALN